MKRLLMIAFHFPPMTGGSGIQRTLRFVQHLPALGWQPVVLSADPRAYLETGADLLGEIPPGTVVQRSFALDTARHLAFKGRYLGWMARPDRWVSWQWAAVRDGLRLIEQFKPDAIWSTYPIATAHKIGAELQRRSGLPWIADFRDPMAQDGYPADPATWQSFKAIEERALRQAAACVFTTPSAARTYKATYPEAAHRIQVIENGYDEESFKGLDGEKLTAGALNPGQLTLLHSGIVYPSERDPTQFFEALANVLQSGKLPRDTLKVRFRAAVHDDLLQSLAVKYGLQDVVELCPPIPYRDALAEMLRADALLVMQAANCNAQVPAKLYEYLRAGRPILGLTDPDGDTAQALRNAGIVAIARLDSVQDIETMLSHVVQALAQGHASLPFPEVVHQASRKSRAIALSSLLTDVVLRRGLYHCSAHD
jgi:glycosyltransferase involved in cell wall biosynthesis